MPISVINGIRIYSEWHGEGAPVVLVHGSWGDHHDWDPVVPGLARTFRTLTYDRRGHSQSERPASQGSIEEDVADLALLIAAQHVAPAHIVGHSFGGSIVLKLAAARPDLFASLTVHEPPLIGLLGNDPGLPADRQRIEGGDLYSRLEEVERFLQAVIATLQSGRTELGAQQFVETALGPGMWDKLPTEVRQTFVFNAPTWLDEMNEQGAYVLDLGRLAAFDRPALISRGEQSAPFFGTILDKIGETLPHARRHIFDGAGHVPNLTHPDDFVSTVREFIRSVATARS
jgi:pimeloyl-ACP methyl ester carboxylesterase